MIILFGIVSRQRDDAADAKVVSDDELVRVAQAEPARFTMLYERYLDRIYAYCYLRLQSREAAEDATSEIFLEVFVALPRYQERAFAAWLFRIAHNTVVNSQKRRPTTVLDADRLLAPGPTLEDAAVDAAERHELLQAISHLADEQRNVLELDSAGWSGGEIAAAMGKSEAAVRMLRHRAVERLKQLIIKREVY